MSARNLELRRLCGRGFDVCGHQNSARPLRRGLSTSEAGTRGQPDEWQLRFASAQGRTILTADQSDFARLHRAWLLRGDVHAGIIIISRQSAAIGTLVTKLLRLQQIRDAEGMMNSIWYLSARADQVLE